MWKLESIQINNIISFHNVEMKVEQDVATLIFGQNLDNENQKANGSGKSSLIEAIAFGLTGETLRKVKTDEIINDECEEAGISMNLHNDFLNEDFVIEREISRSAPQIIRCYINGEQSVQASVADYNKFILDKIGLTKDDIYSNYILCRNKYKSFFDSSDKDKKEIINRFSNGILVDESIEKLKQDMGPLNEKLTSEEQAVSKVTGKLEAVEEQIVSAIQHKDMQRQSREQEVANLNLKINEKRNWITTLQEKEQAARKRFKLLDDNSVIIEDLEKSDKSFTECYHTISDIFKELALDNLTDYDREIQTLNTSLESYLKQIAEEDENSKECSEELGKITASYNNIKEEYQKLSDDCESKNKSEEETLQKLRDEIADIDKAIGKDDEEIKANNKSLDELRNRLSEINNLLHGAITCPKCNHKFSLQSNKPIDEIEEDRVSCQEYISHLEKANKSLEEMNDKLDEKACEKQDGISKIKSQQLERQRLLDSKYNHQSRLRNEVDNASRKCMDCKSRINGLKLKVDEVNGKISNMKKRMFDEAFNIIDARMDSGESYIKNTLEDIEHSKGVIEGYRERINELKNAKEVDVMASLQEAKKGYEKELEIASANRDKTLAECNELKQQEAHFVAFKTHLANTKIDAISAVTNEYLERIGSDLRVVLEGYRILKSGKLRDKITVNILRNGVDCGSIEKLSAGEKTRICLASIIALQHLTNSACENGKGLDLVIADEILDASDIDGLMSYCEAINHLQMTAFIITQNAIAENYPYKLVVTKKNGISTI